MNLFHPWEHFNYFKLTEKIRQHGDSIFIDLLNSVRVRAASETYIALRTSRSYAVNNHSPSEEAIHLFVENSLNGNFNNETVET